MTVEEIRGNMSGGERGNNYDNFPIGMRVLAVDDDPICLKLLDGLLRKCQYQGKCLMLWIYMFLVDYDNLPIRCLISCL